MESVRALSQYLLAASSVCLIAALVLTLPVPGLKIPSVWILGWVGFAIPFTMSCCLPASEMRSVATKLAGLGFCMAFYATQRNQVGLLCRLRVCNFPVEALALIAVFAVQAVLAVRESWASRTTRTSSQMGAFSQPRACVIGVPSTEAGARRGAQYEESEEGATEESNLRIEDEGLSHHRKDLEELEEEEAGGTERRQHMICTCRFICRQFAVLLAMFTVLRTTESIASFSYAVSPSAIYHSKDRASMAYTRVEACPELSMKTTIPNWNLNCPVPWHAQLWRFWRRTFRRYALLLSYGFLDPAPVYGERMPRLFNAAHEWDPRLPGGQVYTAQSARYCSSGMRLRIVIVGNRPHLQAASRVVWMPWLSDGTEVHVATMMDSKAWRQLDLPVQLYNTTYAKINEYQRAQSVFLQALKHNARILQQGKANFSWLLIIDDDTFVNPPNVYELLDRFCADDFVVLGSRCYGNPGHLCAGTGVFFSRGALADLDWKVIRACQIPQSSVGEQQTDVNVTTNVGWVYDVDLTTYIDFSWATRWRFDIAGNRVIQDISSYTSNWKTYDGCPDDFKFFRFATIHPAKSASSMAGLQCQLCGGKGLCRGPEDYRGTNIRYQPAKKWEPSVSELEFLDYCSCDHNSCRLGAETAIFSDCLHGCPICGKFAGFYPPL